jgi:hypothetical protein
MAGDLEIKKRRKREENFRLCFLSRVFALSLSLFCVVDIIIVDFFLIFEALKAIKYNQNFYF